MTEIDRLRSALKECVDALDSPEMMGVWQFLYVHGYQWTGPVINMDEIRELIEVKSKH